MATPSATATESAQWAVPATADGSLLPPGPVGETDPAALAASVLEGGDASIPALAAALSASGFAVRDLNGSFVRDPAEPRAGLALLAGQVIAIAKLEQNNVPTPAADFMRMLSVAFDGQDDDATAKALVDALKEDVRSALGSKVPTVRFWGSFMNELGRQGQGAYDMRKVDPASASPQQIAMAARPVVIDPVQGLMILTALLGALAGSPTAATDAAGSVSMSVRMTADSPCGAMSSEEELVRYGVAPMVIQSMVGRVYERLGGWIHTASKALERATIVLAILRLLMAQASLRMTLELAGPPPVVRTPYHDYDGTPEPGQTRTLTATVGYDVPTTQYLSCLAILLAPFLIDTNMPKNGAWPDAIVSWWMEPRGPEPSPLDKAASTIWKSRTVLQWAPNQCMPKWATYGCATVTDANGETQIDIEGVRQPEVDKSWEAKGLTRFQPVRREVLLGYTVSKQNDLLEDLLSVAGIGPTVLTAVTFISETVQRIGARGQRLKLVVKDWDWCLSPTKWSDTTGGLGGGVGGTWFFSRDSIRVPYAC